MRFDVKLFFINVSVEEGLNLILGRLVPLGFLGDLVKLLPTSLRIGFSTNKRMKLNLIFTVTYDTQHT